MVEESFVVPSQAFCFSPEIKQINAAISKAQAKFPIIEKSGQVDFTHNGRRTNYSYADLAKFVKAIQPFLAENELIVLHDCKTVENGCSASTFIGHSSGEWIKSGSIVIRPSDNKAQTCGSAVTYSRRYSLTSFLGLCSEDEDDDAAAAGGIEATPEKFGSAAHLALAAQIMTKHSIHKDKRKEVVDWLVRSDHSADPSALDKTIEIVALKIIQKESSENDGSK